MAENEQGEAVDIAADVINQLTTVPLWTSYPTPHLRKKLETIQTDLLSKVEKSQASCEDLEKWNKHVREKSEKGLILLKRSAKAGAKAYKTVEDLIAEVHELQEKWNAFKTVPDDQLNQLIAGWEKCLTDAGPCFEV